MKIIIFIAKERVSGDFKEASLYFSTLLTKTIDALN